MLVFYNRYRELCAKRKKSISAVAEEIGLSRASANGWKNGALPNDANFQKLADYFGVSVEYLKGFEEEQKKNDILTDAAHKTLTNPLFGEAVIKLYKLSDEKLKDILPILTALGE